MTHISEALHNQHARIKDVVETLSVRFGERYAKRLRQVMYDAIFLESMMHTVIYIGMRSPGRREPPPIDQMTSMYSEIIVRLLEHARLAEGKTEEEADEASTFVAQYVDDALRAFHAAEPDR